MRIADVVRRSDDWEGRVGCRVRWRLTWSAPALVALATIGAHAASPPADPASAASAIAAAPAASAVAASASAATGDWPVVGHDAQGTRFSPLDQITTANVATL